MRFLILLVFCPLINCNVKEQELKVNYLESLIDSAFRQTEKYEVRKDNRDFFNHGNYTDVIYEYGTFDFIVVGAGSSGSIVAARLSEVEKWNVLLLEAGDWDDDLTDIPYIYNLLQFSDRNWGYYTVPQKNGCFGWKNNKFHYVRGKVLGGSGTINGLGYVRGNKGDYDEWSALGNAGWSFDELLPFFKKMENFESEKIDRKYRGFGGPLNVAYKKPEENLFRVAISASELGFKHVQDYNAGSQLGISRQQRNIEFGRRVSGATAYVRSSIKKHNFNLTLKAFVTKIIIDESTKTANGVLFIKNGIKYRAIARKEVIISGGAINSPQLLMLSGIGPNDELKKHNIKPAAILPVGVQTKDHVLFTIFYRTNYTMPQKSFKELVREYLDGKGMLTNLGNGITYYKNTPVPRPIPSIANYIPGVDNYFRSIKENTDFHLRIYLLHPKAVGSLKLKSNNPKDFPLIDSGIFSNEEDLEVIYEAVESISGLEQTAPAKEVDAQKIPMKFCDHHEYKSKDYWYCAIRHIAFPAFHICSTVKMGPKNDPLAVVDHKLKVYGIKNLRVADCSIMPTIISGHTNAVAFVIGEKVADIIKREHNI
ncbi:hypothetical protein HHI36_018743 [Cryptolaemus montrouzieri]|uniref:Glucose-methanol-choline oxidoreductase N-terminal domain-containing protein n=1 Tax=Cryptolaemus montrouzieri TaxID=559131 RepID=A0ABD2P184_9CUCU